MSSPHISNARALYATANAACPLLNSNCFPTPACGASPCRRPWAAPACPMSPWHKVVALIALADASLGQIPQNHFYALEVLRVNGSPGAAGDGCTPKSWPASALAMPWPELGTKTAHDRTTHLTRAGDGFRITGRKFYATGAIYAQRIPTSVVDDNGVQHLAFVPRDSDGPDRDRRLERLRPAHHRQRFGGVRQRAGSPAARRDPVPERLRTPDHRRPAGADPPRRHRHRHRPRRL